KVGRQVAAFDQGAGELCKLIGRGQVAKQQQIGGFFKAIALAAQTADQIIHIVPAVPQFALTGNFLAVPLLKRINAGNVGDTSQHAFAVLVAQPAFAAEFVKQGGVDLVIAYSNVGRDL